MSDSEKKISVEEAFGLIEELTESFCKSLNGMAKLLREGMPPKMAADAMEMAATQATKNVAEAKERMGN